MEGEISVGNPHRWLTVASKKNIEFEMKASGRHQY